MSFGRFGLLWTILFLLLVNENEGAPVRKTCGAQLSRRVSSICGRHGGYNVFINGGTSRRQRRSIVQECCKNTCTDKDLSHYCRYAMSKEISSFEDLDIDVPERVNSPAQALSKVRHDKSQGLHAEELYPGLPPIKFGTVSPEYTKQAMSLVFSN